MQIPRTRFLLLAFMLLLRANGLNIGSTYINRNQQLLPKLNTTLPDLVTDTVLSSNSNREVKVTTFARTMAR